MSNNNKKLAVIGDPVAHSLSPQMHNAALKYLGLDLVYSAVQVKADEIANFVEEARKDYLGFNITVPHKNNIIPYLDEISISAQLANSVNTVKITEDGKLLGHSTDGYGLEMALKKLFNVIPENENFLFIGCGGAAQATSAHLLEMGAKSVNFVNRSINKAQIFVDKLKKHFQEAEINVLSFSDDKNIDAILNKKPVIVQSTSVGLKNDDPLILPEKFFRSNLCYFDMIYKDTRFLKYAKKNGCKTGNGMLMLLYQGAKSLSIWTNKEAPVKIMKNALDKTNS